MSYKLLWRDAEVSILSTGTGNSAEDNCLRAGTWGRLLISQMDRLNVLYFNRNAGRTLHLWVGSVELLRKRQGYIYSLGDIYLHLPLSEVGVLQEKSKGS